MENITQETTERLRQKILDDLRPLAEQLAEEGRSEGEIVATIQKQLNLKIQQFYNHGNGELIHISQFLSSVFGKPVDSKAEAIFYNMLRDSDLKFQFQYNIGPYRVDYLFGGFLAVELDGPEHDKDRDDHRDSYIRNLGYQIIRVPIWMLASLPDAVIDSIKEGLTKGEKHA